MKMADDLELIDKLEADGILEETVPDETIPDEPEAPEAPVVDVEAIKAQARAEAEAEFMARQPQPKVDDVDEDKELQEIADLQYNGDYVEAERRRANLAEKRAIRTMQAQYGSTLAASGQVAAVADAKAKLNDRPPEVQNYVETVVRDLGIQGPVPPQLLSAVKQLAWGAAAMAGVQVTKPTPKTLRATGSLTETPSRTSTIPTHMRADADEFAKAFGKDALENALKDK
jgi:hypothetical protein